MYGIGALARHFRGRPDVYVSGDLLIYYREGDPRTSIAPDVFVVFGVEDRQRQNYKLWEEGRRLPSCWRWPRRARGGTTWGGSARSTRGSACANTGSSTRTERIFRSVCRASGWRARITFVNRR
ncbi:MAG: hypothetical protein OXH75_07165 [Acidobacteria bacterium]|nr:hypothetical protein [Acidobacteriota bacterium]